MNEDVQVVDCRKSQYFEIDNAFIDSFDNYLDIYEKMIYVVLCRYTNSGKDEAFPKLDTIAKKGSMSKRKVIDCIKSLEEKLLIKKVKRDNSSNIYYILQIDNAVRSARDAPQNIESAPHSPQDIVVGAQHAPERGAQHAPNKEIYINKKINNIHEQTSFFDNQENPKNLSDKSDVVINEPESINEKQKGDPRISEFIKYFKEKYKEKVQAEPIISYGKDSKLAQALLKNRDINDLKLIIDFYFNMEDQWLSTSGYSIGKIASCVIPKYDSFKQNGGSQKLIINSNSHIPQANNYEQRTYDDKYYEDLYYKPAK
jgi:hypothetical protein